MVNWNLLQNATTPDNKPTPGWLFHEICQDVRSNPKDCSDVAEYLMQCICSDQLNVQLKAVLTLKHLAAEDITFQQYMLSCGGALKILQDIAAPPIVPQARSLEPPEVKTVRDATQSAIDAIHTPHTVEKQTEAAGLKTRIQGFGNYEPPPEEEPAAKAGVAGQAADFVADSIGDMVDDFREKGAVGALKDATIDALDLVLDGVDTVWGWVAGRNENDQPRICQPAGPSVVGSMPGGGLIPGAAPTGAFQPPPQRPPTSSATNHYAAAFGGGVVGANNPVMVGGLAPGPMPTAPAASSAPSSAAAPAAVPEVKEPPPQPAPAPMVDLLSIDEPATTQAEPATTTAASADLLGDMGGGSSSAPSSAPAQPATVNMLDF